MGYTNTPAAMHHKMAPILAFFLWAHQEEYAPFTGSAVERKAAFARHFREFLVMSRNKG
jgi:hypothetical protein